MTETLATGRRGGSRSRQGSAASDDAASAWFVREVLPLEALLMHYLRRNWQNASEVVDLRQEVYARVFDAARKAIPDNTKRFLLATARNLLINLVKREHIVQIEVVADFDTLDIPSDAAGPDRVAAARDELRHLQAVLDTLPPRTREAILLTYVEDLKIRQIAARMGVAKSTASTHLTSGLRMLADILHGDPAEGGKKS
jgi:RNA polymerase sigma factor (sigma-70 family)